MTTDQRELRLDAPEVDVLDVAGGELPATLERLRASGRRLYRLDVRGNAGWRLTLAPRPANRPNEQRVPR